MAYDLSRKTRQIEGRLQDTTCEQREGIENVSAVIGRRMYEEACNKPEPEVAHDPGQDHELEAYVAAVRELVPGADRWAIEQYRRNHGISPEEAAKRWKIWKQLQESKK